MDTQNGEVGNMKKFLIFQNIPNRRQRRKYAKRKPPEVAV